MINGWVIAAFFVLYIGALFGIAYLGDRARDQSSPGGRPTIYALTLAVYCTSWTFYGSIGFAAATGMDFIAVYLGPIAAFAVAMPLIKRVTRLSKAQNITSIADFIAARYGKSPALAAIVTIIAVAGMLPYIALQLKAISQSIAALLGHPASDADAVFHLPIGDVELLISLVLAAFAILFGARYSAATEHHRGLMLAIAVESIVKVFAFLSVGAFIVFAMFGGFQPLFDRALAQPSIMNLFKDGFHGGTLLSVTFLSFACVFLLPRQFHVTFVENNSESELRRAAWLFPLYLVAINIFVVPVAVAGLLALPVGYDKDMYLLSLPLHAESKIFTLLAFLGGLSAATAMVVVETIALSIMVSNELIMPLLVQRRSGNGHVRRDMSRRLLHIRRSAILAIVLMAYGVYDLIEQAPLAAIGLLSFAAIAQFTPAFFGGLIWRRATARGAIAGILAGFAVWFYTLFLPYLADAGIINQSFIENGPYGLTLLRPEKLFYLNLESRTHGVVWSMFFNIAAFVMVSLLRAPEPIERLQANIFIEDPPPRYTPPFRPWRASVSMEELLNTVSRYLGEERTKRSFHEYASSRGISLDERVEADVHAVRFTENLLASAIGAASSRLVLSLTLRRRNVGVNSALKLLDDASEAIQYNRDLLQTALDHAGQGLAVFDKDMRLICWNRQFREILSLPPQLGRFGIPLDQIVRFMAQRVHTDRNAVEEFVTDRITKYVVSLETFHERSIADRIVEVRTNAMPQGGIVVTYMDITEREKAAEALARANETLERRVNERTAELTKVNHELKLAKARADEANLSKTRFLAATSHDILQPLNAARLYSTSLIERAPGTELSRLARNIDASLEAVEEILNALLDISRLDTGAMKPELSSFPVNDLFEQLRVDFEPIAKVRGLTFTIVPSAAFIRSDRRLLRRIVQNLVSNALKYTERGGVVLGCRTRGQNLLIQVHDTGPGIPDHQRELIFKEFQRLDHKGQAAPGLGLGLSIVERMCRVLDHPLTLRSTPGRGSTFSVAIPIARWTEIEKPRPLGIRASAGYGDLRGAIILCLDNDRDILDGMTTLLTGWQCVVLTATDSADALQQLGAAHIRPDIVISDYHLENENGVDAVKTITQYCGAEIPTIVVTADRTPSLRSAISAERYALLQKPIKPAALRALMAQMILKRRAA